MRLPWPRFVRALAAHWRVGLLLCVTTLLWMAHYDRWTLSSWELPTNYYGDSLEILARIHAASEGDSVPFRPQVMSRLGAPFGANWSAYPSSDLLLIWLLGKVAAVIGLFPTANIALLLATISAALSFYGCARWLRVRWEWAFASALLFAFTYQTFHRGLPHLFIVFSWTVPLALLSAGIVAASRRVRLRSGMGWFCVGTAAVVGVGNPYTLFLFLQLVGWAVVGQWLGARRRENIVTGLVTIAVGIAAFFLVECHVWLFAPDTAAVSPIVRNYGGTERYALKPIELFLPPATHRWEPLAFLGQRYVRWSDWRMGEAFASYLGLVGIAGFIWLAVVSIAAVLRRRRLPGAALPVAWVLAFASVGGLTNLLAFFTGITVFRATNRYSMFVSAIVLLFLALRLTRLAWLRPRWISLGAAAAVAVIGLADEMPRATPRVRQQEVARRVTADIEFGERLERLLPDGAMIFQLPVMGFPEVVPPYHLPDYEHFRPFLGTQTLRFTYGSLKGRSRGRWQREIAALPPVKMVRRLEAYGFAAVYLNRRGFPDHGEKLLAQLAEAGRTERLESTYGEQVVVLLRPARVPLVPVAHALTFGYGWHEPRPGEPRWAYGPAALSYFNPHRREVRGEIRLIMQSVGPRHLLIRVNGGDPIEANLGVHRHVVRIPVELSPGVNRLDLESIEPAVREGMGQDQLRTFAIYSSEVRIVAPALAVAAPPRT
ncbi:MAG TPA: hypothetical protein VHE61_19725 [Opitutaceae bacterium]|nr:hypothetical protein [Opitutaceae bacterium]